MLTAHNLQTALGSILPITTDDCELRLAEGSGAFVGEGDRGDLMAALQLIIYDKKEGRRLIRDIKEQVCVLVRREARMRSAALLHAYLQGWAEALRILFTQRPAAVEILMPHDLTAPQVFELLRPQTSLDFAQALATKKRLGRWR